MNGYERYQEEQFKAWEDEQAHLASESAAAEYQANTEEESQGGSKMERIEGTLGGPIQVCFRSGVPFLTKEEIAHRTRQIRTAMAEEVEEMPLVELGIRDPSDYKDSAWKSAWTTAAKAQLAEVARKIRGE